MSTPEQMWDNFIAHHSEKNGFIDKNGKSTMQNFIGGIAGYRTTFLEANNKEAEDAVSRFQIQAGAPETG